MNSRELLERLLSSGLADDTSIQGCSEDELSQIALVARRPLPKGYREFMWKFGKQAGRFLRDVDFFFPAVLMAREIAVEILQDYEEYELSLPPDAFVFSMRNKEQFMFFGDASDDPPIMFYMSGDATISRIADSFWDFIEDELKQSEYNYGQVKDTPYDLRP